MADPAHDQGRSEGDTAAAKARHFGLGEPHPLLKLKPPAPRLGGRCTPQHFRRVVGVRLMPMCAFLNEVCWLSAKDGYCYAFQATLADRLGVHVNTIARMSHAAEKAGHVTIVRTGRENLLFPNWERLRLLSEEVVDQNHQNGGSLPRVLNSKELRAEASRAHAETGDEAPAAAASRPIETEPEEKGTPAAPPPVCPPLAGMEWPDEARCRELDGPGTGTRPIGRVDSPHCARRLGPMGGPAKSTPSQLPPELRAKLLALSGGRDALSALAGARLTAAQEVEVVERVLAYHAAKGVVHAGKFIHGPIRDVQKRERDEAELREAKQHDDWDAGLRRAAAAVEAQRVPIPISPPPKPLPKRTKLEERRDTIEGTLALPVGFLSDEKRAELERELREVEAEIASGQVEAC